MTGMELRLWRVERKLTIIALAKALKISRNTLWNWENSAVRTPRDIVERLERVIMDATVASKPVVSAPVYTPLAPERVAAIVADLMTRRASWQDMTDEEKQAWHERKR